MQELSEIKTKNRNNRIKVIPANDLKQDSVNSMKKMYPKSVFNSQ